MTTKQTAKTNIKGKEIEIDFEVETEDSEIGYWEKALEESNQTLKKLKSAIKYETATNEMCRAKLEAAKQALIDND